MIKKLSFITVLFLAAAYVGYFTDWDDHLWYFWHDLRVSREVKANAIWLPDYQVDIEARKIPGIKDNASGITFDPDRKTLWVVVNNPTLLLEMDLEFRVLRRIALINFIDTEAVAYVRKGLLALCDERDQALVLARIDDHTRRLDRKTLHQLALNLSGHTNKGMEGVAVNPETLTIYTVRERDPMKLIQVSGLIDDQLIINIDTPAQIDVTDLYLDDLSGLHYDADTHHLLILSDESKMLAEIDFSGNKISYMDLEKGFCRLSHSIPQPEGVTIDDAGHLYIVSEPNLIYRFTKNNV